MPRTVWSIALRSSLALALSATPGCIGKRRPQPGAGADSVQTARTPTALVGPEDVDGTYDALVEGERVRATYDARDPAYGADQPLVTIVEYSDFQCPFCSKLANTLHEVTRDYRDDVKLVFKQLPLPMHSNAEPAARAALAAHEQGKFWEMHDLLFANQRALDEGKLTRYATDLGLDMERWRKDFVSDAIREHAATDKAMASALTIRSTPTFYVNGKFYKGAQGPEKVRAIIDQEILEARKLLAAGVPRNELYARFLHPAPVIANAPKPPAAKPAPTPEAPAKKPAEEKEADDAPPHERGEASRKPNYAIAVGAGRPTKGPADALVTIIAFSAFDCEECRALAPVLEQVRKKYPKDVRVVFRQLAENTVARRSAQIALAAHKQGKFWPMHDALMAREGEFTAQTATDLAKKLNLDIEKFTTDLRDRGDGGPFQIINEDKAAVDVFRSEAPAPLFFVNGRYLDRNPSLADFEKLVIEEKAKAQEFLAENNPPKTGLYEAMRRTWRGAIVPGKADAK